MLWDATCSVGICMLRSWWLRCFPCRRVPLQRVDRALANRSYSHFLTVSLISLAPIFTSWPFHLFLLLLFSLPYLFTYFSCSYFHFLTFSLVSLALIFTSLPFHLLLLLLFSLHYLLTCFSSSYFHFLYFALISLALIFTSLHFHLFLLLLLLSSTCFSQFTHFWCGWGGGFVVFFGFPLYSFSFIIFKEEDV